MRHAVACAHNERATTLFLALEHQKHEPERNQRNDDQRGLLRKLGWPLIGHKQGYRIPYNDNRQANEPRHESVAYHDALHLDSTARFYRSAWVGRLSWIKQARCHSINERCSKVAHLRLSHQVVLPRCVLFKS